MKIPPRMRADLLDALFYSLLRKTRLGRHRPAFTVPELELMVDALEGFRNQYRGKCDQVDSLQKQLRAIADGKVA